MFFNLVFLFKIISIIQTIISTILSVIYWSSKFDLQMIKWEIRESITQIGDIFYSLRKKIWLYQEEITKGIKFDGDKLCVFASFEPTGILDITYKYLKHLREDLGFSICFVSSCNINDKDIAQLTKICFMIIRRENKGHDFGSYKDGILKCIASEDLDFSRLKRVLIANDSILPLYSFKKAYDKSDNLECDFWGFTESKRPEGDGYFIGTYFMCFKSKAFLSDAFKDFWDKSEYISDRLLSSAKGEFIFSEILEKANLKSAALIDGKRLYDIINNQQNIEVFMDNIIASYPETSRISKLTRLVSFLPVLISSNCYWNPYFALKYVPEIPYIRKWAFYDLIVDKKLFIRELKKLENTFLSVDLIIENSEKFKQGKWEKKLSQHMTPNYFYTSYYT